jgi:hypothetical protein
VAGELNKVAFQLPLSGSQRRTQLYHSPRYEYLSTPSLGITSGSLSCRYRSNIRTSSAFNSLSRDHDIREDLTIRSDVDDAFNSLSRDHGLGSSRRGARSGSCFQLPLSGSQEQESRERARKASSGSRAFNSLSRDHFSQQRERRSGSTTILSTPSLGITTKPPSR